MKKNLTNKIKRDWKSKSKRKISNKKILKSKLIMKTRNRQKRRRIKLKNSKSTHRISNKVYCTKTEGCRCCYPAQC